MVKAKFWMVQLTVLAMLSLVFGSPVWADDHEDFDDQKWHEKFEKKFEKKMAKHPDKAEKWQKKYDKKLAKHNAKHHSGEPVVPPADETPSCPPGTWDVNGDGSICL